MRSLSRRAVIAIVTLLLVGASALLFQLKAIGNRGDITRYTSATVTRGDIVQVVNATGQLSPLVNVEVSSQISGLIAEVAVDFNSPVRKGALLARIDPATYEQRWRQAKADLAAAEASKALASLAARRLKFLRDQDLVTQQEFDEAQAQLQQATALQLTRVAAVENARVDVERCTITSPIDGVVVFKQVEVGKTIVSSFSAPTLFVIAQDLSKMRIVAPLSEVDVWSVRAGQPATFTVDALPDRVFHGRVVQIRNPYSPSDRQQQQSSQQNTMATFDAVIDVDNEDLLLRPSVTVNVSIVVERLNNVLKVPNGALRFKLPPGVVVAHSLPSSAVPSSSTSVAVYRIVESRRSERPEEIHVALGISDSIATEVRSGLREGDRVITGLATSLEGYRPDSLL